MHIRTSSSRASGSDLASPARKPYRTAFVTQFRDDDRGVVVEPRHVPVTNGRAGEVTGRVALTAHGWADAMRNGKARASPP